MEETRLLNQHTVSILILIFGVLMACETVHPDEDAGDDNGKDSVPTFTYRIVETGVSACYNNHEKIPKPTPGDPFYGQDGNYTGSHANYVDNGDGTITDLVTGLMWQQDMGEKRTFALAKAYVSKLSLAGHSDWRIPTIKELYSLIQFTGMNGGSPESSILFINSTYFIQPWGDTEAGERYIDAQTWSSTEYVGTTMNSAETVFGVNFVDGRIKGYPKMKPGSAESNEMYFRLVRESFLWN